MLSYATKRITRGKSLFLALFLSVALAATLFSGILQGADAVGGSLISSTSRLTSYDIVLTATNEKNITKTNVYEIDDYLKSLDGVDHVDHFIRMDINLNSTSVNGTVPTIITTISPGSELARGVNAPGGLEDGKIYMDLGSMNATKFATDTLVSLGILTYKPFGGILDFQTRYFSVKVSDPITITDQLWSLITGRYGNYISSILSGYEGLGGRPQYNLVVVTENTYRSMLNEISGESRLPTIIHAVAALRLNRASIINTWDITGTQGRLKRISEQLNGMGAVYGYGPRDYLSDVLDEVAANSARTKLSTIIITIPVFFTAWYLGLTVSDVALGLRRREIGLLFTRGFSHRQVYLMLLTEALLIGTISGLLGVAIGSLILPFVIAGTDFAQLFKFVSPATLLATVVFSLVLSLLSVINPIRKTTRIEIVDALSEYRAEEEELEGWKEPFISLLIGLYKPVFLLTRIDIEALRPVSEDFIVNLLYNTWYGLDYLLGFIWPILLFWGFTKLFLLFAPHYQAVLGNLSARLSGDAAWFASISSRRNLKRAAAYTFMVTLIVSYSVVVIGDSAITNDYMDRFIRAQMGADAYVILYSRSAAPGIAEKIRGIQGVESAAIEIMFIGISSLGEVPVRAVELENWNRTAYLDELSIDEGALAKLKTSKDAILETGAAKNIGIKPDGTGKMNIDVERYVYTLNIVSLFGRDLGENWVPQNPTIIAPLSLVETFDDSWIQGVRVIVKLKPGVDIQNFKTQVKALGPNVQRVDVTSIQLEVFRGNMVFAGSQQVVQLGIIFAAAVSSLGVALIMYTLMKSRSKELNLMSIRGYDLKQLLVSLAIENVGLTTLATALGLVVGYVSLIGQVNIYNKYVFTYTSWRVFFPSFSQLQMVLIFVLLVAATAVPIVMVLRRINEKPSLKG